ncbi:MAG: DUF4105 domain-containing protein [Elusimicrobia bacterium]|nr:DUF4105 domain-containing protein [Elusimicrobiota bacterium]
MNPFLLAVLLAAPRPALAASSVKVEAVSVGPEGTAAGSLTAPSPTAAGGLAAPVLAPSLTPAIAAVAAPAVSAKAAAPAAPAAPAPDVPVEAAKAAAGARFEGGLSAATAPEGPASAVQAAVSPARPSGLARWRRKAANLVTAPLGLFRSPRNDRNWSADNAVLPYAEFSGDKVVVRNVRNASYRSPKDYDVKLEDRTYDLKDVEKARFIVEPFGKTGLMAHTFLTFDFRDGRHLSISVEVRKVQGESYSPWKGLFNNYEVTYVVADEADAIGLRVNHRKSQVYMYPVKAGPAKVRELFTDMLVRATDLRAKPEFYNTFTNTCLSNIQRHLNRIADRKVRAHIGTVLPGLSDRLAYRLGLIDTALPFAEARERFHINGRAPSERAPDFSESLRR